jgi:hypothetical protein
MPKFTYKSVLEEDIIIVFNSKIRSTITKYIV